MKKIILILLLLPMFSVGQMRIEVFDDTVTIGRYGLYNVCLGKTAGKYLALEKYCIIVGSNISDSLNRSFKGRDMVWYVDYDEPLLKKDPEIKFMLFTYEERVIKTGNDVPGLRKMLNHAIMNYYKLKEEH